MNTVAAEHLLSKVISQIFPFPEIRMSSGAALARALRVFSAKDSEITQWTSRAHLLRVMEYVRSNGRAFGVKLVRGAYLKHETEQAMKHSRPSRVCDTQQDADNSYNAYVLSYRPPCVQKRMHTCG